jgi:Galactose oxidase-like, Early set domain
MAWRLLDPQTKHTIDMAVHAALIPGGTRGKILYFGGYFVDDTHTYDIESESIDAAAPLPGYNIFCSGHSFLADGRLLIGGGQLHLYDENGKEIAPPPPEMPGEIEHAIHGGMTWGGERRSAIYYPIAGKWEEIEPLNLDPAGNANSGGRWYPTLVTLANGEILAVGGHPDLREDYPSHEAHRHSNNVPERYTPSSNAWTLLGSNPPAVDQKTADDPAWDYDYQRTHLLTDGRVFFASPVRGKNRAYDPWPGQFSASSAIDPPADAKYRGISASWTSVLLPLLHQEYFRARVLLMGGQTGQRIDLGAQMPAWAQAGNRDWPGIPPERNFVCPVILPTGQIFFSGGSSVGDDLQGSGVRQGEIYNPSIDWGNGQYSGSENWETVEPAEIVRHYHSVALLLPNGAVWTAGSNGPSDDEFNVGGRERRIEIYEPWYFDQQSQRPTISNVPKNVGYAYRFRCNFSTAPGSSVSRVVLIRCGSVTHGFNPDQRMLSVAFDAIDGNTLEVQIPLMPEVFPPGRYLLWIVDDANRPCQWAHFIRISKQKALFSTDYDKFAKSELDARGTPATFDDAVYLVYDGFLPDEVSSPSRSIVWADTKQTVPGMSVALGNPKYEAGVDNKDIAQRVVYPCHITFENDSAFDAVPDDPGFRAIELNANMGYFSTSVQLTLTKKLNPRMSDGDPHWLSVDLRAFSTTEGAAPVTADIANPSTTTGAYQYIQEVLNTYNSWDTSQVHPFQDLPTQQETNKLPLYSHQGTHPLYNFAIARVRFRAPEGVEALNVRVFFRLWTTGWTALEYDTSKESGSYPRDGDGAAAAPRLGLLGGEVNTIPCFAEPREERMTDQKDLTNLKTIGGVGSEEIHTYYGCLLDFNQDVPLFPLSPAADDPGPYTANLLSILQLMRGLHQCLVAEIHYWPDDEIPKGETPSSSDNLAQRNLIIDETDNPGSFASHLAHHTFQIKPTPFSTANVGAVHAPTGIRLHADELVIDWRNLPRDSHVTLYFPQIDPTEVLRLAALRQGPGNLARAGSGTLLCKVSDIGFIPIPGPLSKPIAALLTVQLPPGIAKGQKFTIVLRQVDGRSRKVLGTTQFDIHVKTASQILPHKERSLGVLKHIALSIPPENSWSLVFKRYIGELEDRVRALGGNPEKILPSPGGPVKSDPAPWLCGLLRVTTALLLCVLIVLVGLPLAWPVPQALAAVGLVFLVLAVFWQSWCRPTVCQTLPWLGGGTAIGTSILALVMLAGFAGDAALMVIAMSALITGVLISIASLRCA